MRKIASFILPFFFAASVNAADFKLTSSSYPDNGTIPALYSCDGKNISPALNWSNPPTNTQYYALILNSPDWTSGNVYLWVLYNIPASVTGLVEGANMDLPAGIKSGATYYFDSLYHGPCPPDHLSHHYVFTLYALDGKIDLPPDADIHDVLSKIDSRDLKKASYAGVFKH